MTHQILISVGSNIDKEQNISSGLTAMNASLGPLSLSQIYESESVGFAGFNFLNLVVLAYTDLTINEVCQLLKDIENKHGRVRDKKFANRTLDLDLLTYGDVVCELPIILPREEILYNAFVLRPTAELVPNQLHPSVKQTYAALWQDFKLNNPNKHQKLWPSSMQWSENKK